MSKSKLIQALVGFAILIILSVFGVPKLFSDRETGRIDSELVKASSEWNTQAPLVLDDYIQIDNHVALAGKNIQGSITFTSLMKNDIDRELLDEVKMMLVDLIKTDPLMSVYRKKKVTILYHCKDIEGYYIDNIKITPNMYN